MANTNEQPLAFRTRGDVAATVVRRQSGSYVVADPLTLEHYELSPRQWFVAEQLRGATSLAELARSFARAFAPQLVTPSELWQLVGELHRLGLVIAVGRGQAEALQEKRARDKSEAWRWGWMQLLSYRMPGIQPRRIVNTLYAIAWPALSPLGLMAAALLMLTAISLVTTRWSEFVAKLPAVEVLWSPACLVIALVTIAALKTLHELGHAVVARHFGVEASEMGIMLLAGMPCLYTDVSDAWRLERRGPRMAIAVAGVATELLLAAIACLVWWYSQPGILQLAALGVMTIASLGTLLVNANPLLRYDGYYLLSDLTGASNLWTRSRLALRQWTTDWVWHRPEHEPTVERESWWLAVYGLLSQTYIFVLLLTLSLSVWRMVAPRGLDVLAYTVIVLFAATTVIPPVRSTLRTLANPAKRRHFRWGRALVTTLALVAIVFVTWQAPIRYRAACPVRVDLANRHDVVNTLPGRLMWAAGEGTRVAAGDIIARFASDTIELDLQAAHADRELAKLKLDQATQLRSHDSEVARELPGLRAELEAAEQRLMRLSDERERLVVRAPASGVIVAPADRSIDDNPQRLASWTGTPLDRENLGAYLEAGTVLAIVAAQQQVEIHAGVGERDIAQVAAGQPVRVQLDERPGTTLTGHIVRIADRGHQADDKTQAWRTSVFDSISDRQRYEAIVALDQPAESVAIGSRGWAKIELGQTTVGAKLLHALRGTVAID